MSGNQIDYVSDASYEEHVALVEDRMILLDFTADWCEPCLTMLPILEEISAEFADVLQILKVDLDDSPDIVEHFGVMSIPTLILVKNGEPIRRIRGAQRRQALVKQLTEAIDAAGQVAPSVCVVEKSEHQAEWMLGSETEERP